MPDFSHHEATLVADAIAGDADAFGMLYMHHLDAIYRYVYFRVGDANDAEDLTEQVFLKAWEALPGYKQRQYPFKSWLYRIAANVVVDYHREQKAMVSFSSEEKVIWKANQAAPLERIIESEEAEALAGAIAQLSEEQQLVIILRFIEGLSHAEVAHIVNKSEGACRVIQYRALAALNQLLTSEQGR